MKKNFYFLVGVDISNQRTADGLIKSFINFEITKNLNMYKHIRLIHFWPIIDFSILSEFKILNNLTYVIEIKAAEVTHEEIDTLLKDISTWSHWHLIPYLKFKRDVNGEIIPLKWYNEQAKKFFTE